MVQTVKLVMSDWQSDYLNVKSGRRVTTDQPSDFNNRIHVLGASDVFGYGAEDAHTFCSFLQRRLNQEETDAKFRVENLGIRGSTLPFSVNNLIQTTVSQGDIVILCGYPELSDEKAEELGVFQTHVDFSRPHEYGEVFIDQAHLAWTGNKAFADKLYEHLFDRDHFRVKEREGIDPMSLLKAEKCLQFCKYLLYRRTYLSIEESAMQDYLAYLDQEKVQSEGLIGSVAVNCNPMTNGHLHLLEHAARSCAFLYVFVIEEDKSYFSFEERLDNVTKGLAHLPNVKVLKGGRYICTDITFPEYSTKSDANDVIADASMEGWFFAEFIAARLGISRIFLGREPTCKITQQYNDQIEEILPKFGIDVEIIERISFKEEAISASRVRALLRDQRFDKIREIVPDATYDLLYTRHRA